MSRSSSLTHIGRGLLVAIVLTVALAAAFSPILLGGDEARYGMLDHWHQSLPNAYAMDTAVQGGEVPLWNPLLFCGTPLSGHPGWHPFYPPNLLRSFLVGEPTPLRTHVSMAWFVALHVLLAGLATYLLARELDLTAAASLVAALAFVLSAAYVHRVCANHFMKSLPWLPLALLFARRTLFAVGGRARWRNALAGGLVLGMLVLGGPPQIVYYAGIFVAVWVTALGVLHLRGEGGARRVRSPGGALFALAVSAAIGTAIGAAILLPALEFTALSARSTGSALELEQQGVTYNLRQALRQLLVFPGRLDRENLMVSLRRPRFAGLGVAILAVVAFTHRDRRQLLAVLVCFYVFLDISLGRPFPLSSLVHAIAPYQMGNPDRGAVVACLPLGLLAGFGTDALVAQLRSGRERLLRAGTLVVGIAFFLFALREIQSGTALSEGELAVVPPALILLVLAAVLSRRLGATGAPGAPGATGATGATGAGWRWEVSVRWAMVAAVGLELVAWNIPHVEILIDERGFEEQVTPGRLRATSWTKPVQLKTPATMWSDNTRVAAEPPNQQVLRLRAAMNGYDPLYLYSVRQVICGPGREELYSRSVNTEEVTGRNGRGFLFLKRAFWLAREYVEGPLPPKKEMFPPTTTVFLSRVAEGELPVPRVEREDVPRSAASEDVDEIVLKRAAEFVIGGKQLKNGELHELASGLRPRHSVLRVDYAATGRCNVDVMLREKPTGRRFAGLAHPLVAGGGTLEVPLPDWRQVYIGLVVDRPDAIRFGEARIATDRADENELIEIVERGFNSVTVEVGELDDDRLLVFVDADYPGWEAFVDDEPVPIHGAAEAFKAVHVPPGTHRVRFEFNPASARRGVTLSLAVGIASLLALVFLSLGRASGREVG